MTITVKSLRPTAAGAAAALVAASLAIASGAPPAAAMNPCRTDRPPEGCPPLPPGHPVPPRPAPPAPVEHYVFPVEAGRGSIEVTFWRIVVSDATTWKEVGKPGALAKG